MHFDKSNLGNRVEGVLRGMLGLALFVAAGWALANGNGEPQGFDLGNNPLATLAQAFGVID